MEDEYSKMKKQRTPGTYEWYLVHDPEKAMRLALEQKELSKEKAIIEPDIPREPTELSDFGITLFYDRELKNKVSI